jgi:hypothetical protein
MSHAQSQRYAKSRATQPCPGSAAETGASGCCRRTCPHQLDLSASSVSLPGAGTAFEGTGPGRGCQGCFYRQTLPDSGPPTPGVRHFNWAQFERACEPSRADVAEARAETWLKDRRMTSRGPFGWNTDLIGCWLKSLPKPTNCSCLNDAGWRMALLFAGGI